MIRVLPATPEMCKHLKHPNGIGFIDMTTPREWPADQFTFRLLAEGAIRRADAQLKSSLTPPLRKLRSGR